MERLSSDNWVWNYTVIYINRDARSWEGGWLIIYYFLAVVPIIEFSDMFCCEQLPPNESKQICDLRLYLEVSLYLGDMGLMFTDLVSCMCSSSQGPTSSVFEYGYLCAPSVPKCASLGKCLGFAKGKKQNKTTRWVRSWLNTKGMYGGRLGRYFSLPLVCFIKVWGESRATWLCGHENNVHIMLSYFS